MANTIIKRIGELSLGKILGIIYAVIGLIIGVIVSFITLIAGNIGMGNAIGGPAYLFGAAAIITMPVFYGIMGFVLGLIIAVIYNLIAGFIGGLEIDLETDSKT